MNGTLFLAEKILVVLGESNQSLEGQLAAAEIVVKLFKAEPYGSLVKLNHEAEESIEASSQYPSKWDMVA